MHQISTSIMIRKSLCGDAAGVAEVVDTAFAPLRSIYHPIDEVVARQAGAAELGTRLVAVMQTPRVIGTVQFDLHKDRVHLVGLAVHPRFQRTGVARRMVDAVIARAMPLGYRRFTLETIEETGNIPVFEKLGFRIAAEKIATWCKSDKYPVLHEIRMERVVPER